MRIEASVRAASACSCVAPSSVLQQFGDLGGADLFQLVDGAQHPGGVFQAQAQVEALGQLAVVHAQAEVPDGQGAKAPRR